MTVLEIHLDERASALTPDSLANNPLMKQDLVYALPLETISALHRFLVIDDSSAGHEMELAEFCRASGAVGIWQGAPIQYSQLQESKQEFEELARLFDEYLKRRGDHARINYVIGEMRAGLLPQLEQQRAYAGWLVTNRLFRAEIASLARQWTEQIDHHGLPRIGSSGREILFHPAESVWTDDELTYIATYAALCRRWRLAGLASLDLPVPVPNHLSIEPASLTSWHRHMGGGGIHVADIYTTPSRDQFQRIIGEQLAHSRSDHLEEWSDIIRRRGPGGIGLRRYGHVLAVNHYWDVIRSRYFEAAQGHTAAVDKAIGQALGQSEETVRQVRLLIQQRLAA